MTAVAAAPCRHAGAPPRAIIDKVSGLIEDLGSESALLAAHGLTAEEFTRALPMAIESLRGTKSASNADSRKFLEQFFDVMLVKGLLTAVETPAYGDDTVYRLSIPGLGDVAVIQKGCPDGAHSSVRWSAPDWAKETYLWWLCSSLNSEPGEHVVKGVNRLRQRFFSEAPDVLDGIIFHNELCGGPHRPCPKSGRSVDVAGHRTPPPCVYVMPARQSDSDEWNWTGNRHRMFPKILLATFGIEGDSADSYIGHVGFRLRAGTARSTITSRFGPGRSTTFR
jgi:hypothetical protein